MTSTIDTLHIRDAVSKTIIVNNGKMTLETDVEPTVYNIPSKYLDTIERFFDYAYSRADEFEESEAGVTLEISGGMYSDFTDGEQYTYEKSDNGKILVNYHTKEGTQFAEFEL